MADLKDAKIGSVIICGKQHSSFHDLYTVERLTKTQVVCDFASFKIDTGLKIGTGGGYNFRHGRIATQKEIAEVGLQIRMRQAIESLRRFTVTADNLEAVEALLKAGK